MGERRGAALFYSKNIALEAAQRVLAPRERPNELMRHNDHKAEENNYRRKQLIKDKNPLRVSLTAGMIAARQRRNRRVK